MELGPRHLPSLRIGMMRRMYGALVLLSVFSLGGCATLARADDFSRYCNGRFGFCVDYPTGLVLEPEPDNGDGRRFHDSAGFLMMASAMTNASDDTLEREMNSQAGGFDRITYQAKGKDWFVLSGSKGSHILYRKTYIGPGAVNRLYFEYPATLNKKYNPIVTKISRSFEPGDLVHGR